MYLMHKNCLIAKNFDFGTSFDHNFVVVISYKGPFIIIKSN